ncbi:dihydrolipoamide acetyltransferase family protein [Sporolactobacillus spathodeae]|uniref:Dihydrolipoamide acetyltransferase component of pyruvate dehydrogenase complex n=1 Tax=Sporolactobacillus spathodeae TaxID=1465502 RepID=A0ABS2Q973_9BACL|nr:dihydrolipoamide acetyltransferase family protein [Sporolactobacillus spathodeae]MBM7657875.1 pyruvate dehydrogenase E2 component (dihydrolipoamide acetyltransferase) [Sporolactobacillus spathodeae]
MATEIIMPKMGMGMSEGTVVEWLKSKGDTVKKGESVVSISSDKIEKEIEAPEDGILLDIEAEADDVVAIGKALGYIGQAGEAIPTENTQEVAPAPVASVQDTLKPAVKVEVEKEAAPVARLRISPAARRLAKAEAIDLSVVTGTGPLGRITKADVALAVKDRADEKAAEQLTTSLKAEKSTSQPQTEIASVALTGGTSRKMSGMRKVIAARMYSSLQESAQLTLQTTADVTALLAFQKQARAAYPIDDEVRLTVTDFIAKAVIQSLLEHKKMNSLLENDTITEFADVHLGVAVALDEGLVVPVIKDADKKSLSVLSREIRKASKAARSGQMNALQLSGSTFTVTSLGTYGVGFFTPVLNPPETGILGVGQITDQPVYVGESLERRSMLPLSLTFDHRVVDGAQAAEFLKTIKNYLEAPFKLVL